MLRNVLTLIPALAFALPFMAAQPTMARPLATPATPAEWCWGGNDDCGDDDLDQAQLQVCTQTIIAIGQGDDDRAYECDKQAGPACLASCTADAVAPICLAARSSDPASCQAEQTENCRSACEAGGAMFCAPEGELQARWGDWGFDHDHGDDDDDDDDFGHGFDQDGVDDPIVFIDSATCLALNLDQDNR